MKKILTKILVVFCCLSLCSCNSSKKESYLILAENNNTPYKIIYGEVSDAWLDLIEDFALNINEKCNIKLLAYKEDVPEANTEILIGNISNRPISIDLNQAVTPTGYTILKDNQKIIISATEDLAFKEALDKLTDSIVKVGKNSWGINEEFEVYGDVNMNTFVPKIKESIGILDGMYYTDNGYEIGYKDSAIEDFDSFKTLLETNNFIKAFENNIGTNSFVTYYKDDAMVNISYYENKKRLHMLYGKKGYLPIQGVTSTKIVEPTITQIKRIGASQSSPGLSIVCQLIDGSYIIIDGGPEQTEDEVLLLNYLKNNNPNQGKPQVTWMFTHAHHDHMGLAVSFLDKYHDEIDVNLFCYNFPDFDSITISKEPVSRIETSKTLIANFESVYNKYYQNVPKYYFHAGDKLQLPGCEIEILLTHETFWPNDFPWINHTSSAWTIKNGNKKMMVLGDCETTVCAWMAEVYQESLKCDILQVTHHGLNGGDTTFYEYVDADICFWPIDNNRFENDSMCLGTKDGFEYNAYLRDETIKKREHYAASVTTTINC